MSMFQSVISPSSNLFRDDVMALVVFCEKTNIMMALCHKNTKLYYYQRLFVIIRDV